MLRTFCGLTSIWVALLLATALTAWLAGSDANQNWATSALLAVAAVKVAMVITWFMELHNAPRPWQIAFGLWWLVVSVLLVGAFAFT